MAIETLEPGQDRGPGIIETIDSYDFDGNRFGKTARRDELIEQYGEQGVGWDVIQRSPRNLAEKLTHNMGLKILDVVIMPIGEVPTQRQPMD